MYLVADDTVGGRFVYAIADLMPGARPRKAGDVSRHGRR